MASTRVPVKKQARRLLPSRKALIISKQKAPIKAHLLAKKKALIISKQKAHTKTTPLFNMVSKKKTKDEKTTVVFPFSDDTVDAF